MQYLCFYNLLTINTLQRHKNIINQTQKNRTILLCYVSRNRLFRARANIIITFHKMEKEKHHKKQHPLYNKTQKYKECKK